MNLTEIEIEEKKLNKQKYKLLDKEYKEKEYPKLVKKFLGRFFRTRNRYSSGNGWWLYCTVTKVSKTRSYHPLSYTAFQIVGKEKVEFFANENSVNYLNEWKEISEREYKLALENTRQAANKLLNSNS